MSVDSESVGEAGGEGEISVNGTGDGDGGD